MLPDVTNAARRDSFLDTHVIVRRDRCAARMERRRSGCVLFRVGNNVTRIGGHAPLALRLSRQYAVGGDRQSEAVIMLGCDP